MGSEIATTKLATRWILWYHDPEKADDYTLPSYIQIGDANTPEQFWLIIDSISTEAWENGMFFFMRKDIPPIYECRQNENGGSWSKRMSKTIAYDAFVQLMVRCMTNEVLTSKHETLTGVTISPKGDEYSVLRIWNTTSEVEPDDPRNHLQRNIPNFQITGDVSYTPHRKRNTTKSSSFNNSRRGRRK